MRRARKPRRLAAIAIASALSILGWNSALNAGNAARFNIDSPFPGLRLHDVGSAVVAFTTTALALGLLIDRAEPAGRVVGVSATVGLITLIIDLLG